MHADRLGRLAGRPRLRVQLGAAAADLAGRRRRLRRRGPARHLAAPARRGPLAAPDLRRRRRWPASRSSCCWSPGWPPRASSAAWPRSATARWSASTATCSRPGEAAGAVLLAWPCVLAPTLAFAAVGLLGSVALGRSPMGLLMPAAARAWRCSWRSCCRCRSPCASRCRATPSSPGAGCSPSPRRPARCWSASPSAWSGRSLATALAYRAVRAPRLHRPRRTTAPAAARSSRGGAAAGRAASRSPSASSPSPRRPRGSGHRPGRSSSASLATAFAHLYRLQTESCTAPPSPRRSCTPAPPATRAATSSPTAAPGNDWRCVVSWRLPGSTAVGLRDLPARRHRRRAVRRRRRRTEGGQRLLPGAHPDRRRTQPAVAVRRLRRPALTRPTCEGNHPPCTLCVSADALRGVRSGLLGRPQAAGSSLAGTAALAVAGSGASPTAPPTSSATTRSARVPPTACSLLRPVLKPLGDRLITRTASSWAPPSARTAASWPPPSTTGRSRCRSSTCRPTSCFWRAGTASGVDLRLSDNTVGQEGPIYSPDGKFLLLPNATGFTRFPVNADGTLADPTKIAIPTVDGKNALTGGMAFSADGKTAVRRRQRPEQRGRDRPGHRPSPAPGTSASPRAR